MDLNLTWGDVARATGGALVRGGTADPFGSLSTDSRRLAPGQAFWALAGARFDAHDFLDEDRARAAGGWVVRDGARLPEAKPGRIVEVADTLRALGELAAFHRRRFRVPVVGVTGTNGKTTVKEMMRAVLSRRGEVCASPGNLNNEVGVPLSLLELGESTRFGVFEMGACRRGDIRTLTRLVGPTAGVLTNIGPAHLEFFGDLENVFRTKSELVEGLPPDAPVALNGDDPWLARLTERLGSRAVTFGRGRGARVRVLAPPEARPNEIALDVDGRRVSVGGAHYGGIHRINAAAAAAGSLALGFGAEEIEAGLAAFRPPPLRFVPRRHPSGALLIVDTYNANPASVRAGVETFLETTGGERIVVLGDMAELGASSARLHREVGRWLATLPLAGVCLAGERMAETAVGLRAGGARFPVVHAQAAGTLAGPLRGRLGAGTAVYFKASRVMRLEELVEAL
ncbi:MAG: UDP-N-acetylmuramoyl-tripeptide--D-alanyl-D-alanine ligase [Elusimicrobiota bacterium]